MKINFRSKVHRNSGKHWPKNLPQNFAIVVFALLVLSLIVFNKTSSSHLLPTTDFFYEIENLQPSVNESAMKIAKACADGRGKLTCYANEFSKLTLETDPKYAFGTLNALQGIDPVSKRCHFIAHGIGWGVYKRDPANAKNQISLINPTCGYGANMGIIEFYVSSLPGGSLRSKDVLMSICNDNTTVDCNHILGHMLLVDTEGNLTKALEVCKIFQDKQRRHFCLAGAFMENETATNLVSHGYLPESFLNFPARIDEIEKLCRSYDGEEAAACWKEIAHAAFFKFNQDPKAIFNFCDTAQTKEGAVLCKLHSIPEIVPAENFDLVSLKYMCTLEKNYTFERNCYSTIIGSALHSIPKNEIDKVVKFCLTLDGELSDICFAHIGSILKIREFGRVEIQEICQTVPLKFRSKCLSGNINSPQSVGKGID